MTLLKWQTAEIKKRLKLSRSKSTPGASVYEARFRMVVTEEQLNDPAVALMKFGEMVTQHVASELRAVNAIINAKSRVEWEKATKQGAVNE